MGPAAYSDLDAFLALLMPVFERSVLTCHSYPCINGFFEHLDFLFDTVEFMLYQILKAAN